MLYGFDRKSRTHIICLHKLGESKFTNEDVYSFFHIVRVLSFFPVDATSVFVVLCFLLFFILCVSIVSSYCVFLVFFVL